jgi:hypothetical protein
MKRRVRTAVELLLCHPEATVAEMLGVRLCTLRGWMKTEAFREALDEREREQSACARRLARQAVVSSAVRLCQLASDPTKADAKVLLDVLKASGSLDPEVEDPGAALAEAIRMARKEAADAGGV